MSMRALHGYNMLERDMHTSLRRCACEYIQINTHLGKDNLLVAINLQKKAKIFLFQNQLDMNRYQKDEASPLDDNIT